MRFCWLKALSKTNLDLVGNWSMYSSFGAGGAFAVFNWLPTHILPLASKLKAALARASILLRPKLK